MKKDKTKTMIRSILPSTHRRYARGEKRLRNRIVRRTVRADLRRENFDADLMRDTRLSDVVSWRRAGDKLNHFMRWCRAITNGMSSEASIDHVRSLLPASLVGDHALDHWIAERRPVMYAWFRLYRKARTRQSWIDSTTFRLRRALIVDPTLHGRLNREIKARKMDGEPRRILAGTHDVRDFVVATLDPPHELERRITLELIEQIEKRKGGRKAALRVSALPRSYQCSPQLRQRRLGVRSSAPATMAKTSRKSSRCPKARLIAISAAVEPIRMRIFGIRMTSVDEQAGQRSTTSPPIARSSGQMRWSSAIASAAFAASTMTSKPSSNTSGHNLSIAS
jgi:hypothetical protein